jgi:hypothetical protein
VIPSLAAGDGISFTIEEEEEDDGAVVVMMIMMKHVKYWHSTIML